MNNINLISFSADELSLSEAELTARLRIKPDCVGDEIKRAVNKIESLSERKCVYATADFSTDNADLVDFGFVSVKSASLVKFLGGCDKCVFFAASLGIAVERYVSGLADISITERYFADAVASAYIESVCDRLQRTVEDRFGETTGRFSPGYGDLPLDFQRPLLDYLDAGRRLGVSLTESLLMIPRKSVSGIIGVKNVPKE